MNLNCRSIVHFTSLCVPFLELSKNGNKSVVILTMDSGEKPNHGEMLFSTSKAMTNMFIECMALELAYSKIRVNGVSAGTANTMFRIKRDVGITEYESKIYLENVTENKPLKVAEHKEKLPSPDNIADVILWLASNESSYITGEIIKVDDGMSLTSGYPKPKSQIK
mmetsp:Transcript_10547/g.9110  ORF Transcript_10547/g.9110 Transcript_10547/m.9110 type:complete len:166 (+) Transcript_10547:477-974(+)